MTALAPLRLLPETLLLIPCSGAKRDGRKASKALSILSSLDPARAVALTDARPALRENAQAVRAVCRCRARGSEELVLSVRRRTARKEQHHRGS